MGVSSLNTSDKHPIFLIGFLFGPILLFIAWCLSAKAGIQFIGALILPKKGILVIPCDFYKSNFTENFLHGKFFTEMFKMEELPLDDIQKITREKGTSLYIHGKFGSVALPGETSRNGMNALPRWRELAAKNLEDMTAVTKQTC